jgi:hypothetical protein
MRRGLWLAAMLLPFGGCDVTPSDPGYDYGYAQPGYPAGGYYAPGPYAAYPGYPGYDGAVVGGGFGGFYDSGHRWHGERREQERRESEGHFHHDGAAHGQPSFQPGPDGRPAHPGARPGGQAAFRPPEPQRSMAAPRPAPAAIPAPAAPPQPQRSEVHRACAPGKPC